MRSQLPPDRGIRAGVRRLLRLPVRTTAMARADADAELDAYIEARVEYFVARGMTADDARAEALRRLGGSMAEVRAALRDSAERREGRKRLRDTAVDAWDDLRYAARSLTRRPGFAVAAILCLGIGIGANATMFGVVDALLFRPPSAVRDPGSLVWINVKRTAQDGQFEQASGVSIPDYLDFLRSPGLIGAAAYSGGDRKFGRDADARRIEVLFVTHTFMSVLGVSPALGRFFAADEDRDGPTPVVVLGYAFWQNTFAGDVGVIGKTTLIDDKPVSVVGVAPRDFNGVGRSVVDVYQPLGVLADLNRNAKRPFPLADRHFTWFSVVARLTPKFRRERLAEELSAAYHFADAGDTARAKATVVVASPTSMTAMSNIEQVKNVRVSLWLYAVAGIVLLIACANVASLLLTRAVGRRREIAVRLALGIGRGRLVRLLMAESLLLAAAGCVAGLLLARWGGAVIRTTLLSDLDAGSARLDARVLAVTLAMTAFTGLVCGIAPALLATRPNLTRVLKSGERDGSEGRGRVGGALLVGQVALTLMLLVGAGVFVQSLRNLDAVDFGFDVRHVLRADAAMSKSCFSAAAVCERDDGPVSARANEYFDRVVQRTRAVPGVERLALATSGPFGVMWFIPLSIPGHPAERGFPPRISAVSPDFFATLGMTLRSGRVFTTADNAGAARVTIVNEEMARHFWPNGDALGKCIQIGGHAGRRGALEKTQVAPCTTIVGVVHAARQGDWPDQPIQTEQPMDAYYIPFDQRDATMSDPARATLYIRSAGDATALVLSVRRTMQALSPNLPPPDVTPLSSPLARQFRPWRLGATMFGIFGGIALVLAIVGLYGVLAFRVSQRTHEIGIRMAFGAQRRDVRGLVVSQGLVLSAIGVAIGISVSLVFSRLLDPLLFGVSVRDSRVLVAAGGGLLAVALLASYVPAFRATRIDPLDALREL